MYLLLQTDGNTAITTVPGLNYSSDVMYSCDGRTASLDLVWSDDFYLTLDFGAVSISISCEIIYTIC